MRIVSMITGFLAWTPLWAAAHTGEVGHHHMVQSGGVSAIWVLANVSYAGMKAQGSRSWGWRIIAFILGFPGTLLSFFVIPEGGERAYGVDIVKKIR